MFGLIDTQQEKRVTINHLLLIFKFNVYKSRDLKTLNFLRLIEGNLCQNYIQNRENISKNGGN